MTTRAKRQKKTLILKRIPAELPGGFRDAAPPDAILKNRLLEKIRKIFEDFGFDPLETPAVERTEVLVGGEGESEKLIFNVKGSREKTSDLSLRFDLTVPLARFLAANPDYPKPFKRYQIGRVWRGESPQAGRYREFTQADIDIVGAAGMEADAEIISVMYQTLENLGIRNFIIKINNRKILNGLPAFAGFPAKKLPELLRIIDKQDKIGEGAMQKELSKTFSKKVAENVTMFLRIPGDAGAKLAAARTLFGKDSVAEEGIFELETITENLTAYGVRPESWEIHFATVRGLGYYTGAVFETVLTKAPEMGSVFSGGRYDNLMLPFTGQKVPAVGTSLGVDRLLAALGKLELLKPKPTTTKILILNLAPALRQEYFQMARALRAANLNTAIYLGDDRAFQAQLAYAIKKGIPYVVIYGENEKTKGVVAIKDLTTREQTEVSKNQVASFFKKTTRP